MSDDLSIPSPTYRIPRHRRGMDPVTRRLALMAGGLGAALLVVVAGPSLIGHRSTSVPVVQADKRPIRVKPENPGGLQVAGANEDILSGGVEFEGRQAGSASGSTRTAGNAYPTAATRRCHTRTGSGSNACSRPGTGCGCGARVAKAGHDTGRDEGRPRTGEASDRATGGQQCPRPARRGSHGGCCKVRMGTPIEATA